MNDVRKLAHFTHERYEKHSKDVKWLTQKNCQVPFKNLPAENKIVMLRTADDVIEWVLLNVSREEYLNKKRRINRIGGH